MFMNKKQVEGLLCYLRTQIARYEGLYEAGKNAGDDRKDYVHNWYRAKSYKDVLELIEGTK